MIAIYDHPTIAWHTKLEGTKPEYVGSQWMLENLSQLSTKQTLILALCRSLKGFLCLARDSVATCPTL